MDAGFAALLDGDGVRQLGSAAAQRRRAGGAGNAAATLTFGPAVDDTVDILFVINNMASTGANRQKLIFEMPAFVRTLQSAATPLDLHVAVVTTDMGAPSDVQASIGCTPTGDGGLFRNAPTGTCTDTTLAPGATYLTDDGHGVTNFGGTISGVLACIAGFGSNGCGFGQPLAAAVHALGADHLQAGVPAPPPDNAGFLRPTASLAVILLANEDDCSVPAGTELFSLQGQPDNLSNPLGPFSHYRCNQYGHLCRDPASGTPSALISPPLDPPANASTASGGPTLSLSDCRDNDTPTGLLTPVETFTKQLKALKSNPDNQIVVAALVAPASPYTVAWVPSSFAGDAQPGELWPEMMHSCGAAGGDDVSPDATQFTQDGTFGDPGVRLTQFAAGFPRNVVASMCDPSYAATVTATANAILQLPGARHCLTEAIQSDAAGRPACTVAGQLADGTTVTYANCADTAQTPPCWTSTAGSPSCAGVAFSVVDAPGAPSAAITVTCAR